MGAPKRWRICGARELSNVGDCSRDRHGIPKCCPCPSVVFLMLPGPSVRFRVFFLGGEYVCPSYGPLKFLKLAKLGQKSVRPFVK